jgi:hypothetical protein
VSFLLLLLKTLRIMKIVCNFTYGLLDDSKNGGIQTVGTVGVGDVVVISAGTGGGVGWDGTITATGAKVGGTTGMVGTDGAATELASSEE